MTDNNNNSHSWTVSISLSEMGLGIPQWWLSSHGEHQQWRGKAKQAFQVQLSAQPQDQQSECNAGYLDWGIPSRQLQSVSINPVEDPAPDQVPVHTQGSTCGMHVCRIWKDMWLSNIKICLQANSNVRVLVCPIHASSLRNSGTQHAMSYTNNV